jgi:formylglycine-generating enzyme required for sulfatase activity
VPRDLAVICLKALEKQPDRRYTTMKDFAADLERFLSGDVILARPPAPITRLVRRVKRNPALSTAVGAALGLLAALALYVIWSYPQLLRERNSVMRLSDVTVLEQLRMEAEDLWPAVPGKIGELENWMLKAEELAGRYDIHLRTLKRLRDRASISNLDSETGSWVFESSSEQWWHDLLAALVTDIEDFRNEQGGLMHDVAERLRFARTVHTESIEKYSDDWQRARQSIADPYICPLYNGLDLEPQLGLIPIGLNTETGLWEFGHLQTGAMPRRGADGKLAMTEDCGLVFVLIPGGSFDMGSVPPGEDHPEGTPNVETGASECQGPVHRVDVEPFFISKYEMSQGQWLRFTGANPSAGRPGARHLGAKIEMTLLHPVEMVSCIDCEDCLTRLGLRLPSEAEWEYAARAGTGTAWWTGIGRDSLAGAANIADLSCRNSGIMGKEYEYEEWLDDGYAGHAPVSAFEPNPFGLHNVYGNVWEWCPDSWKDSYEGAPCDGSMWSSGNRGIRVTRGGGWNTGVERCKSASRRKTPENYRAFAIGLRPTRSLD